MGTENSMRHMLLSSCFRLLLVLLFLKKPSNGAHAASDSIMVGASLTGNQTRISKGGIFELGFFNLENNNIKKWYVGIWYAMAPQQTVVWVANVEQPLQNASAVLNLTEDGSILLSYGRSTVWSSQGNGKKPSSAVIMDSGNLVVLSAKNASKMIWQSFDYPENTCLPTMKLSNNQRLWSWRSPWDPSPGHFSLMIDPRGADQLVMMWKNHTIYWESGLWKDFDPNYVGVWSFYGHMISFVRNGSYKYVDYFLASKNISTFDPLRVVMDKSGHLRVYVLMGYKEWFLLMQEPYTNCEVYAACGPYGSCNNDNIQSCNCVPGFVPKHSEEWESSQWSSGCVRKTLLRCNTDGFVELSGKSKPPHGLQYKGKMKCKTACLSNCSCIAYAYLNNTSQACVMWFGELLNLSDTSNGISLFLRLDAADVPLSLKTNKKVTLTGMVGGAMGGLVSFLAFVFLFLWCCKHRGLFATDNVPVGLTVFTYRELQNATKNFSERLGGGGFGSVFRGTLRDGSVVAVKKLEGVNQGDKQFCTEVSTLGITQHVNLVRLRGFCTDGCRRLLVYEYMLNGSLNSFLFHKTMRDGQHHKVLDWRTRFDIAVGTARGIVYLHEKCKDCIIHCDIKPENILLDSNLCPKLADFGLAKLLSREYKKVLTTMRGTRGYLAPEWISGLPITVKADTYSFGMTLLEIIAGRRNRDRASESGELYFPAWAAAQITSGNAMEVLDKKLLNDVDAEQVERVARVVGWCIQEDEEERPLMSKVLQILEGIVGIPPLPPIPLSLKLCADDPVIFFWDEDSSPYASNNIGNPTTPL